MPADIQTTQKSYVTSPAQTATVVADWVTAKVLADPREGKVLGMSAVSLYFKPGQGHARHNHPDNEQFIFVVSGEGEMMVEEVAGQPVVQPIRAGDCVSIPRGAYHSTFNTGWEPIRIFAVYSPGGPEAGMEASPEFTVHAPGDVSGL